MGEVLYMETQRPDQIPISPQPPLKQTKIPPAKPHQYPEIFTNAPEISDMKEMADLFLVDHILA